MPGQRQRRRRADLSQHFLRSSGLARTLVRRSQLSHTDLVIEIGAGSGVLTEALAEVAHEVQAIEVDPQLSSTLSRRFAARPAVRVVLGDFFETELPRRRYSVFANVPFTRSADVVRRLVEADRVPEDAHLVLQLEAAARFAGQPYGAETVASLRLKPWWHLEIEHWFRRSDFSPPPRVDSVLLHLGRRARPLVADAERADFNGFVEHAFGRGTIARGLRDHLPARTLRLLAQRLSFDLRSAPSALSFEQWLGLFRQRTGGPVSRGAGPPARPRRRPGRGRRRARGRSTSSGRP